MGRIEDAVNKMGQYVVLEVKSKSINSIIEIICGGCGKLSKVTMGAAYRQARRGKSIYKCRSCSIKEIWSDGDKKEASRKAKNHWKDPDYAGTITGKALANEIKKSTKPFTLPEEDNDE